MNSKNKNTKLATTPNRAPWILIGLLVLIVTVVMALSQHFRSVFVNDTAPKIDSSPTLPKQDDLAASDDEFEAKLRKEYEKKLQSELAVERQKLIAKELEDREPPSPSFIFEKPIGIVSNIINLSNGIPLRTETVYGDGDTAIREIQSQDSYTTTYQVKLRIPRPAISISEIEIGTPELTKALPGFKSLFSLGFLSPWYQNLYQNKISYIRKNSGQLVSILSKADAYDCNTILHLSSEKGRKVFFIQADMDAALKGSDGDRLMKLPDSFIGSIQYDPFTAYQWTKKSDRPNPMIAEWSRRIEIGKNELGEAALTKERKAWVGERIKMLESGIHAMKQRSYLISAYDPYIVIPLSWIKDAKSPYSPKIGDYAILIYGSKIYPCIVGDSGSDTIVGEASARIAFELNPEWKDGLKSVERPIVSYLVFPESRDIETSAPDYKKWEKKCLDLLNEIGGLGEGYELHRWSDQFPKQHSERPK